MKIQFNNIKSEDLNTVLFLFKEAAEKIAKKKIDHWQYWKNPPIEKINWVIDGIKNNEFFFIHNEEQETIGMVRILKEDYLYWGKQDEKALYIHSLVVRETFNGNGIGKSIIEEIENKALYQNCDYLRLDSDSKNPKLCNYYETQGFKKVGAKKLPLSTYNLYQKKIN